MNVSELRHPQLHVPIHPIGACLGRGGEQREAEPHRNGSARTISGIAPDFGARKTRDVRREIERRSRGFGNESLTRLIGAQPIAELDTIGLGKCDSASGRAGKKRDLAEKLSVSNREHAEPPFAIGRKIGGESGQPLGENRNWRGRRDASGDPRTEMIAIRLENRQQIRRVFSVAMDAEADARCGSLLEVAR